MVKQSIQHTAMWYGYSGLIPFIALALLIITNVFSDNVCRVMFDHYSAIILSFMAGVYWPLAMREEGPVNPKRLMIASIGLALWGWMALMLPETLRALAFAAGFFFLFGIDRWVLDVIWSNLYLTMRSHLTAVVVSCQIVVALFG